MTAQAPRLPLSLEPLIAEAKHRARQRRALLAVLAVLLVAAAAGAGASFITSGSSGVAVGPRPVQAAFEPPMLGQVEQPNGPVGVFAPRFGIALIVENGSSTPVTLESVRAVLGAPTGPHVPVGQIGTRFKPLKQPKPLRCAAGRPCTIGMDIPPGAERPIAAERPTPLRLATGHRAVVQLNARFLACSRRQAKEVVSIQRLTFAYRLTDGTRITQYVTPKVVGATHPVPFGATVTTLACRS